MISRPIWLAIMGAALTVALTVIPTLPTHSETLHTQLTRSLAVFATARTLNGIISVAQSTGLGVQPAGVGISIDIGELLDPVNDLIEHFSSIMLLASSAIAAQRIALEITASVFMLGLSLAVVLFWYVCECWSSAAICQLAKRLLVLVIMLRLAVPLAIWSGQALDHWFLQAQTEAAIQGIQHTGEELQALHAENDTTITTDTGWIDQFSAAWEQFRAQLDWNERLERYQQIADEASRHIVLSISLFMLQTVFLPIFWIWLFARLLTWGLTYPSPGPSSTTK